MGRGEYAYVGEGWTTSMFVFIHMCWSYVVCSHVFNTVKRDGECLKWRYKSNQNEMDIRESWIVQSKLRECLQLWVERNWNWNVFELEVDDQMEMQYYSREDRGLIEQNIIESKCSKCTKCSKCSKCLRDLHPPPFKARTIRLFTEKLQNDQNKTIRTNRRYCHQINIFQ